MKNAVYLMNTKVKGNRFPEKMLQVFTRPIEIFRLFPGKIEFLALN